MFYQNLIQLCADRGTTPTELCHSIGLAGSAATKWKSGSVPRDTTLKKIADYFGVSTEQLLHHDYVKLRFDLQLFGDNSQEKKPPATKAAEDAEAEEDELTELLQELKTRPEMKMLFSLAKGATKEDVELAVQIIERMRRQGGDGE